MGVDFAGNYACLAIGYLEKVKLFGHYLPLYYTQDQIKMILEAFLRYVDDGWMFWPTLLDIDLFISILKKLHHMIKWTVERGVVKHNVESKSFLAVRVILHNWRIVETESYYKDSNNLVVSMQSM